MVTVALLKENGYPVGSMKDENQLALAERSVMACYFPTSETFESEQALQLLYALTFSMLLKRRTVATRYGASEKTSQYTIAADNEQIKSEIWGYCAHLLDAYYSTLETEFEYTDVLEIYSKLFLI